MKNTILLLTILASSQSFAGPDCGQGPCGRKEIPQRAYYAAKMSCHTKDACLVQVSSCRMSDRNLKIHGNELVGYSKYSYTLRRNTVCHKKYETVTYPGTYSDQDNYIESSVIDSVRMPDSGQEAPASNKAEVRRMDNCNEARADFIATYPRCK